MNHDIIVDVWYETADRVDMVFPRLDFFSDKGALILRENEIMYVGDKFNFTSFGSANLHEFMRNCLAVTNSSADAE